MPSPLGHMLGGVAAGWLVAGRPTASTAPAPGLASRGAAARGAQAMALAALGAAPDLDLLAGLHSSYTHSLGAVAVVIAVGLILAREQRGRWALAAGAAVASHILLDWLGSDTSPPIGIMALWPFTRDFYQSSLHVFPAVSRRYWQWSFVTDNALAVVWELAILAPVVVLIRLLTGRKGAR